MTAEELSGGGLRHRPSALVTDGDARRPPPRREDYDRVQESPNERQHFSPEAPSEEPIPWKSIALGFFLFILGICAFGGAVWEALYSPTEPYKEVNKITGEEYTREPHERFWPFILLGFISFIPGVYIVALVAGAVLGLPGYSLHDIPQ